MTFRIKFVTILRKIRDDKGMSKNLVLICMLIFLSLNTSYASDYYSEHAIGWHWYDDPKEANTKKEAPTINQNNPNVIVKEARNKITMALNQAIAEPTIENVEKYIALQEQLNKRAEKIADLWQQALLKNTTLNYSIHHPTNNVGLQVYHEQESQLKDEAIKQFSQKTGLFFFYKSTCPYCARFAPIIKSFAERNGMTIIPITLDGNALPEFPNSKIDSGQAAQFHVTSTPAAFAVNPYTQKAFPVAYGLTSETELRDNIYNIMTRYQGEW